MVRWILPGGSEQEHRERARLSAAIDQWWQTFTANTAALDAAFNNKNPGFDVANFMHNSLNTVDRKIRWEFGPGVKRGGHRLVITPESSQHLRPMTDEILARAPDLPGWEFYRHRLRDPAEQWPPIIQSRTGIELQTLPSVIVKASELHGCVDLTFEIDKSVPASKLSEVAFLLAQCVLGEESLERDVGALQGVHVQRSLIGKNKPSGVPLSKLPQTFDDLLARHIATLPDRPWHEIRPCKSDSCEWSGYNSNKDRGGPPNRTDLITGSIVAVEGFLPSLCGPFFYSSRLSRFGEHFIYVQAEATYVPREERADHRYRLQDALDDALAPLALGAVIGGAAGTQYDYIDLAVTDLPKAAELIAQTLRAHRVPRPSWIRCHDIDYALEWRGIWDDLEPPPPINWD